MQVAQSLQYKDKDTGTGSCRYFDDANQAASLYLWADLRHEIFGREKCSAADRIGSNRIELDEIESAELSA